MFWVTSINHRVEITLGKEVDDHFVTNMDIRWILSIATLCLCLAVYTPITVYLLTKFMKYSSQMVIAKRHPQIFVIMMILGIIYLSISRLVTLGTRTMLVTNEYCFIKSCKIAKFLNLYATTFFYSITFIAPPLYLLLKYWMIYYDIKWMQATFNLEWKSLINPYFHEMDEYIKKHKNCNPNPNPNSNQNNNINININHKMDESHGDDTFDISRFSNELIKNSNGSTIDGQGSYTMNADIRNNFWLKNRISYGNEQYMLKKCLYLSVILVSISLVLWYILWIEIGLYLASFYDALIVFLTNIGIFIIHYKTPKFSDNFFVRLEMKCVSFCVLFAMVSFIAIFMTTSTTYEYIFATTHANSIAFFAIGFCQTQLVFIKCKNILNIPKSISNVASYSSRSVEVSKESSTQGDSEGSSKMSSKLSQTQMSGISVSGTATAGLKIENITNISRIMTGDDNGNRINTNTSGSLNPLDLVEDIKTKTKTKTKRKNKDKPKLEGKGKKIKKERSKIDVEYMLRRKRALEFFVCLLVDWSSIVFLFMIILFFNCLCPFYVFFLFFLCDGNAIRYVDASFE